MMARLPALVLALAASIAWPTVAGATDPAPAAASVRLDRAALDALRAAPLESEAPVVLRFAAPGVRAADAREIATSLRRIDVYAPDARVLEATADGYRELPRDSRLHFIGVGSVGQRVGLSLDPDTGAAEGILLRDGTMYALSGGADDAGLALAGRDVNAPLPGGEVPLGACSGNLQADGTPPGAGGKALDATVQPATTHAIGGAASLRRMVSFAPKVATRQATVAVDTDNELLNLKFGNNTSSATAYVAALFTALNAIYEDDPAQFGLQLRMVQGTVILRPSTTADPFNNTDGNATGAALIEFGGWWRNNQTATPRAFALLLSGKSSNAFSASGIAWLVENGSYCAATGAGSQNFGHYSVNQVFRFGGSQASDDAYLVAHELGHNLGARHTHCASSATGAQASTGTIDRCFNGEAVAGCYAGPQSCATGSESPLAPQGTLMSYCHLNGLNCGVSTELHPTHVTQLNGRLASQPGTCVSAIGNNTAPTLSLDAGSATYTENGAPATIALTAAATDAQGNWSGGRLSVSISAGAGADDRIGIGAAGGISVSGSNVNDGAMTFATLNASGGEVANTATLTATFNGSATNARVQALARAIQFRNVSDAPATAARTVAFTLVDGASASAPASRTVTVTAVNDAPTLNLPASIGITEDLAGTVVPVSFVDPDAGTGTVVASFSVPAGTLAANGTPQVTVGGTATARTLTGSLADLNQFLSNSGLSYTGAANATGAVSLGVALDDQGNTGSGGAQSANGSTTLQITAANDAPSVSAPASLSLMAGASVAVTPVSYADVDGPYPGAVTATYSAPSGTFAATAAGGVTVSGGGSGMLTLTGTLAAINSFVAATPVQYTAAATTSGVVPLTLALNDQGNVGGAPLSGTRVVNATVIAPGTIFVNGFED